MEVWAHRGRVSPEKLGNSISDFMACYYLEPKGLTGIEADVADTADQRAIVYHPGSTYPDLTKMTWREIQDSIFDVLPLSSFLSSLMSYSKMPCCLDIKQNSEHLVGEVVRTVAEYRLQNRIYLTAFQRRLTVPPFNMESDGKLLLLAKKLDPTIKTHLIALFPFNIPALAKKYKPDAISFGWLQEPMTMKLISKTLFATLALAVNLQCQIKNTQNLGIKVMAGIVNDIGSMRYFAELGVDGIMTDDAVLGMNFKKMWESARK